MLQILISLSIRKWNCLCLLEMFFLGMHTSSLPTVAPAQLPSLLHCMAGFLISPALLPHSKPQVVLFLFLCSFAAVSLIGQSRTLTKVLALPAHTLQLHHSCQWPEQGRSCFFPFKHGAKQTELSRSRYVRLLYPSVTARCCFMHVQLHDAGASPFQIEHHGSGYLTADALSRLVLSLLSLMW